MTLTTTRNYQFSSELYLDRRRGKYTFHTNPDTVLVVNANEEVNVEELEMLFHPFTPRDVSDSMQMFDGQVLEIIRKQDQLAELKSAQPEESEETALEQEPDIQEKEEPSAEAETAIAEPQPDASQLFKVTGPPPMERVKTVRNECLHVVSDWLSEPEGVDSLIQGDFDRDIYTKSWLRCVGTSNPVIFWWVSR